MFYFHPYLGKSSILTNIFQLGWFNHQPDKQNGCSTKIHRIPYKDLPCGQCHSGGIHWRVAISGYWMGTLVFQADEWYEGIYTFSLRNFPTNPIRLPWTNSLWRKSLHLGVWNARGYLGVLLDFHGRGMLLLVIFQAMRSYKFLFCAFGWPHFL